MRVGAALVGSLVLSIGAPDAQRAQDHIEISSVRKPLPDGSATVTGTKIATAHLELTTYAGAAAVEPGGRFSLVLEITPRPGMHVYAPGASGYRIVSLAITDPPGIRALPLGYPESEIYYFEPLDERVPVYQKPFRLVQELELDADQRTGAADGSDGLAVRGTLEYQACDDSICYNPVSLPLTWMLELRPRASRPPVPR
jgi:DsbC/DsbD-like thiol-disulfide interchange protein